MLAIPIFPLFKRIFVELLSYISMHFTTIKLVMHYIHVCTYYVGNGSGSIILLTREVSWLREKSTLLEGSDHCPEVHGGN